MDRELPEAGHAVPLHRSEWPGVLHAARRTLCSEASDLRYLMSQIIDTVVQATELVVAIASLLFEPVAEIICKGRQTAKLLCSRLGVLGLFLWLLRLWLYLRLL